MRILFDNGTPRGIASALPGHTVEEARSHGWDTLRNGELLDAAEAGGFDAQITDEPLFRQLKTGFSERRRLYGEEQRPR